MPSQFIIELITTECIAVLLGMRVYALYYRNKWVLCIVMFEAAAAISVACVSSTLYHLSTCMFTSVVDSHPTITRRGHFRESDTVSPLLSGPGPPHLPCHHD